MGFHRASAILALLALGPACGGGGSPTEPPAPAPSATPPALLVVTIDGLRPDAVEQVRPPNLLALAARGAQTMDAQAVIPPNTLPVHASLLSGLDPAAHGITWGDYRPDRGTIGVPTLFTLAKAAGMRTALVCGKNVLRQLLAPGAVDHFADLDGGDDAVTTEALAHLGGGYRLVLVHFADVDLTGHRSGWMSEAYLRQIGVTDAALGRLLAAAPAGTTVILTSDHGGIGRDHLTTRPEDMTIPWMIAGPGVAAGRTLPGGIDVKDTAATAARVLGLRLPEGTPSRVVDEAFRP
jgi:predicted AlkP superfamily pyrophosphatase or phosphodiesterase